MTLKQLQKEYGKQNLILVEIKSKKEALKQIDSKTSSCWGAGFKIGNTGWIQLASPSIQHKGDIRTVFVCKENLIKNET